MTGTLMKEIAIATLGVRLVALTAMAFGCVMAIITAVMHYAFQSPLGEIATSDLHLHDTYYVVTSVSYNLVVPSGAGVLVGAALWLASKTLARLICRGIPPQGNGPNDTRTRA